MVETIHILVIDDHPLLLDGLTSTLEEADNFKVLATGKNYSDALELTHRLVPDTILLDISMPGDGIKAAHTIHETFPSIKIIMLTASEDEKDVLSSFQAGAVAYVLKGVGGKELIDIVDKVSKGETFITPSLASCLLSSVRQQASTPEDTLLDQLNVRENTILSALERGLTNKQIADELFLSEKTIKHYMSNILQKLHVKNRVQAALMARNRS
jgi:DNA-binding NarL/FixJ family response regulator